MAIMTHTKFHFNRLMLTLIFRIWASEPPHAWGTTGKAGLIGLKSKRLNEPFAIAVRTSYSKRIDGRAY